jgi:hypothetical protein
VVPSVNLLFPVPIAIIAGAGGGALAIIAVIVVILLVLKRRKKQTNKHMDSAELASPDTTKDKSLDDDMKGFTIPYDKIKLGNKLGEGNAAVVAEIVLTILRCVWCCL